ncbi:MAG TPA: hypothetical protein VF691_08335 [Cytophagaceae bacterium]
MEPTKGCTASLPEVVSFKRDIQPIFNKNCNDALCHSGSTPGGKLNLEPSLAYSNLNKTGRGYIDTIKPESSVLYVTLISRSNPMPPNGRLDECSLALIRKWMDQNAPNN